MCGYFDCNILRNVACGLLGALLDYKAAEPSQIYIVLLRQRNAVFDMAFNQTTNLVKSQLDNYTPEATGLWNNFKKYFQVSNQYVVAKLKVGSYRSFYL